MNLKEYLNTNFQTFTEESIKDHFKNFGVNVQICKDRYQFKYDQIDVKWDNPISHLCRGTILQFNNGWEYLARPWNKFFNRSESRSNFSEEFDFSKLNSGYLLEKLDGSCILVYEYNGEFVASTLGSIETSNIHDFGFSFSDLFWRTFKNNTSRFVKGTTSIFELCTVYNRVVTEYPEDCVVFLGTYSNETGEYLKELSDKIGTGLKTPIRIPFDFNSWKELDEFVEAESRKTRYGINPEGFVYYENGIPKFKCKNETYSNLHKLFTGDRVHVKKNVINLFFQGKLDDVSGKLPSELIEFKTRLENEWEYVQDQIHIGKNVTKGLKENRKEYALKLQELGKSFHHIARFQGYFFELLKCDIEFSEWIVSKNKHDNYIYESFVDYFKTI